MTPVVPSLPLTPDPLPDPYPIHIPNSYWYRKFFDSIRESKGPLKAEFAALFDSDWKQHEMVVSLFEVFKSIVEDGNSYLEGPTTLTSINDPTSTPIFTPITTT